MWTRLPEVWEHARASCPAAGMRIEDIVCMALLLPPLEKGAA